MIKLDDIGDLPAEIYNNFVRLPVEEMAELIKTIDGIPYVVIEGYAFPINSRVYRFFERY
jgi:hypothetical protein